MWRKIRFISKLILKSIFRGKRIIYNDAIIIIKIAQYCRFCHFTINGLMSFYLFFELSWLRCWTYLIHLARVESEHIACVCLPSNKMSGLTPAQCQTKRPDIGSMSDWMSGDFLVAKPVLNGTHSCVCLPSNKILLLNGTHSCVCLPFNMISKPELLKQH